MFAPQPWEYTDSFNPESTMEELNHVRYVNVSRKPLIGYENKPFNFSYNHLDNILHEEIVLPDDNSFVAGNFHNYADRWSTVTPDKDNQVLRWISNGVDIHDFMVPFKGSFLACSVLSHLSAIEIFFKRSYL